MPLLELRILGIHSFPHFSLTCFDILSWNLAYDFVLLYYRSSLSVVNFFVGVMPLFELRILEIHSFPHFSPTCLDILSWKFLYEFVSLCDQVRVSSLCVCLALRPSIHFLHFPATCAEKCSWNLKFDVGFFHAFLFREVLYKNSLFKKFLTGALCTVYGARVYFYILTEWRNCEILKLLQIYKNDQNLCWHICNLRATLCKDQNRVFRHGHRI